MGLERMTAVLQGTHDNYKIDHFKKIMEHHPICEVTYKWSTIRVQSYSNHLRASSFNR